MASLMRGMRSDKHYVPPSQMVPWLSVRKLRATLMLEECLETTGGGFGLDVHTRQLSDVSRGLGEEGVAFVFSEAREPNLVQIADGCSDVEVVTTGTASACGIALQPCFELVACNNLLKFGPGHKYREDGK